MATDSREDIFKRIKLHDAQDKWKRLTEIHPNDLHDGMVYEDFKRLWNEKPNEFERDIWDTYATAFSLDPHTGKPLSPVKLHVKHEEFHYNFPNIKNPISDTGIAPLNNDPEKDTENEQGEMGKDQSGNTEQFPTLPVHSPEKTPTSSRSGDTEKFVTFRSQNPTFHEARPATPIYSSPRSNPRIVGAQNSSRQQAQEDRGNSYSTARNAGRMRKAVRNREKGVLPKFLRPGLKNAEEQIAKLAARPLLLSPVGIIIMLGLALIIGFILMKSNSDNDSLRRSSQDPVVPPITIGDPVPGGVQIPGLTLFLPPIPAVPAGGSVVIPIQVTYSGSSEIDVIAPIPPGARFVSASGSHTVTGDLVVWRLSSNIPSSQQEGGGGGMSPAIVSLYNSYGFPNPTDPVIFSEDENYRWNTFLRPYAERAAAIVGVDVGFIGMWPYHENRYMSHMDNCGDADGDPNTPCNWNTTMWQVGWGVFPQWERQYLAEAMEAMHPGQSIQQIGQAVIDSSGDEDRYPPAGSWYYVNYFYPYDSSYVFPNITLEELLTRSDRLSDLEAQKLVATLMKDDAIGAYILAKKWKGYVDANGSLGSTGNMTVADLMESWPPHDPYNRQRIINEIAGLYNVGISRAEYEFSLTISPADGGSLGVQNYFVSGRVVGSGGGSVDF